MVNLKYLIICSSSYFYMVAYCVKYFSYGATMNFVGKNKLGIFDQLW